MNIVIEKNIPLPTSKRVTGLEASLRQLNIGDSFLYPKGGAVYPSARKLGIKVVVRKLAKDQFRVWRLA